MTKATYLCPTCVWASNDWCNLRHHINEAQTECGQYEQNTGTMYSSSEPIRYTQESVIQHAEFLADAADRFLAAVNNYDRMVDTVIVSEDFDGHDYGDAAQTKSACWSKLESTIYEFRKRVASSKSEKEMATTTFIGNAETGKCQYFDLNGNLILEITLPAESSYVSDSNAIMKAIDLARKEGAMMAYDSMAKLIAAGKLRGY